MRHIFVLVVVVRWNRQIYHLFWNSNFFDTLWVLVRDWLGFFSVDPSFILDHFVHYANWTDGYEVWRSIMHWIWFVCIWVIWQERNDWIFNNKEKSTNKLLDKVKVYVIMAAKIVNAYVSYYGWWWCPFNCLGVG